MRPYIRHLKPALFLALCWATLGCGTYSNTKAASAITSSGGAGVATGTDTTTSSPTTTGATTTAVRNTGVPPYSFPISGTGYDSHTISVSAGKILKVTFSPGTQDRNQSGTGYTWNYTVLGVFISVGSSTKPTPPLANGYTAGQAQRSDPMDFSGSIHSTCTNSDTKCRQQVTITIQKPNNDDQCFNFGVGCPYNHVPDGHPWNGTLLVETDDTNSL
ncbi:hypothetical protein WDW37_08440 [Bdellovibrionota bacterium FG-1]